MAEQLDQDKIDATRYRAFREMAREAAATISEGAPEGPIERAFTAEAERLDITEKDFSDEIFDAIADAGVRAMLAKNGQ